MNIGKVLFKVPHDLRKIFKNYERISKKLMNKKWSLIFNTVCQHEPLWFKYTRIKILDYFILYKSTNNTGLQRN